MFYFVRHGESTANLLWEFSNKYQMSTLARQFAGDNLHVIDLPYRLSSWAFDNPDNIGLWFNEKQQLVAWVVLQTPFWTTDYVYDPATDLKLHPEILAWADCRARASKNTANGRPAWYVMVFSGQGDRIQDLEKGGFKCQSDVGEDSWSKVLLRRSTQTPVKVYRPPAGFMVRPLGGEKEVEAYVELHRSVFESKNMTLDWRLQTLKHPAYKPELDFETDSYRNTAFQLYESFDFQVVQNVLVYRKEYGTD